MDKVDEIVQLVEDLEKIGVISNNRETFAEELLRDENSVKAWKHILRVVASVPEKKFLSPSAKRLLRAQIKLHTKKTDEIHHLKFLREPLRGYDLGDEILRKTFWD